MLDLSTSLLEEEFEQARTTASDIRPAVRAAWSRDLAPARLAPRHVVEGLRAIDPNADLMYIGWGTWRLVIRDRANERTIKAGNMVADAYDRLMRWEGNVLWRANPGALRRLWARFEFAVWSYHGIRPVEDYPMRGEPTEAIVDDFRRAEWMYRQYRHLNDDAFVDVLNADKEAARAAAHADMIDPARGRAAWNYCFTRSHWVGDPGARQRPRSGFTTLRTIA